VQRNSDLFHTLVWYRKQLNMKRFAALLCALAHFGFSIEARIGAATSSHLMQHSLIADATPRKLLNFAIEYKPEGMYYRSRISKCSFAVLPLPNPKRVSDMW
jgi:hypothetical protein